MHAHAHMTHITYDHACITHLTVNTDCTCTNMSAHTHSRNGPYGLYRRELHTQAHTCTQTRCSIQKKKGIKTTQQSLTGFSSSCRGDGGMKVQEEEGGLLIPAHPSLSSSAAAVTIISLRKKNHNCCCSASLLSSFSFTWSECGQFNPLFLPLSLLLGVFFYLPQCCCCCRPSSSPPLPFLFFVLLPSQYLSNYHSSASDKPAICCCSAADPPSLSLSPCMCVWRCFSKTVFLLCYSAVERGGRREKVSSPDKLPKWMEGWMEEVETEQKREKGRRKVCACVCESSREKKRAPSRSDKHRNHISCDQWFTAQPATSHRNYTGC